MPSIFRIAIRQSYGELSAAEDVSLFERLVQHVPPRMVMRYLVVGAWNTLFGYGLFALLTYVLTPLIPAAYMAASVIGTVISITVSFLGYKIFVFRTKGNFGKEYLRCYAVYGTTYLISLGLLPILVIVLNLIVEPQKSPYIAGALLTAGTVVVSFFGHKQYTFGQTTSSESDVS
jgi:putative flippase GtrA